MSDAITPHLWLQGSLRKPRLEWLANALAESMPVWAQAQIGVRPDDRQWLVDQYQNSEASPVEMRDSQWRRHSSYAGVAYTYSPELLGSASSARYGTPAAGVAHYMINLGGHGGFCGIKDIESDGRHTIYAISRISTHDSWITYRLNGMAQISTSSMVDSYFFWHSFTPSHMVGVEYTNQGLSPYGTGELLAVDDGGAVLLIDDQMYYNAQIGNQFDGIVIG